MCTGDVCIRRVSRNYSKSIKVKPNEGGACSVHRETDDRKVNTLARERNLCVIHRYTRAYNANQNAQSFFDRSLFLANFSPSPPPELSLSRELSLHIAELYAVGIPLCGRAHHRIIRVSSARDLISHARRYTLGYECGPGGALTYRIP